MFVWLYGTRNKQAVTALFWLMGFFLLLLLFSFADGCEDWFFFSDQSTHIATSSVWRSHALVALGGVMKKDVCIYRQEFIPVYTDHCFPCLPLNHEVNIRLMFW
jgi:hypothetical protein